MVKKITKYLKFAVCCALILSLIAPSYAALSASDGSAFVTKAEFDSALADFNARLTTFEAGINSKIDSQVTSYLDRNGIWNGAKQDCAFDTLNVFRLVDFTMSTWEKELYAAVYRSAPEITTGKIYAYEKRLATWYGYKIVNCDYDYIQKDFVVEITKSGLLMGQLVERMDGCFESEAGNTAYYVDGASGGGAQQWSKRFWNLSASQKTVANLQSTNATGSTGAYGVSILFSVERAVLGYFNQEVNWQIRIVDQNDIIKYSNLSYNWGSHSLVADSISFINSRVDSAPRLYPLQFFVSKGDRLYFRGGFLAAGRAVSESPFGFFADMDKWKNQMVFYYMTDNIEVF